MTGTEGAHDGTNNGRGYISKASNYGPTIFKVIELVLAVLCIGLFDDPANNSRYRMFVGTRTIALGYVTFGSFIIFCSVYVIGKVFRDTVPWKLTSILNLAGTILFAACGIAILKDWSDTKERNYWPPNTTRMDLTCGTGSVAIVTTVVFFLDLIFTLRLGSRGELE